MSSDDRYELELEIVRLQAALMRIANYKAPAPRHRTGREFSDLQDMAKEALEAADQRNSC